MAATTRAPIADEAPTQTPLTGELRAPIATFRLALVGVCGLLTVLPPHRPNVLFLLLVLSVGMWAGYRSARFARPLPFVEALLVGAAVPWTGAGESPLLPYLLAPGLILGLTRGPREDVLVNGCASSALLVGIALPGTSTGNDAVVVVTQTGVSERVILLSGGRRLDTPTLPAQPDIPGQRPLSRRHLPHDPG